MSVERIRKAILAEAREETEKIEAEARARRQKRMESARKALEEEYRRLFEQARQKAEQEAEGEVMRTRARHRLALLEKRNAILDDLFKTTAEKLAALPDEEYRAIVGNWMQQLPADTPGEVACNKRDAERLGPLIEKLNSERSGDAQLKVMPGDRPSLGGVIFRTEKFEMDLSLDSRLKRLREELTPEVAEIIFPPETAI